MQPISLTAISNMRELAVRVHAEASCPVLTAPIHLAFLLDTSSSMEGHRIVEVKRTLHAARDLFIPSDRITVVSFDNAATTIVNAQEMTPAGITDLYRAVDNMGTTGATNLSAGIERLIDLGGPYDALVILTDGEVNRGITSQKALLRMCQSLGSIPITTIGYGADHNHVLLSELAVQSNGSYTYVSTSEMLPVVMGDLIGGLRDRVCRHAVLSIPGWKSKESSTSSSGNAHALGSIVRDRDYWVVFERDSVHGGASYPVVTMIDSGPIVAATVASAPTTESMEMLLSEQLFRVRTVEILNHVRDVIVSRSQIDIPDALNSIAALLAELDAISSPSSLIVRLGAQLEEAESSLKRLQTVSYVSSPAMARMISGAANISTQRGYGADIYEGFSSPAQRQCSSQCQTAYASQDPCA